MISKQTFKPLNLLLGAMMFIFSSVPASAWTEQALSVSDPSVFNPNDFSLDNVKLDTKLKYEWIRGSLEWVRLDHQVTVPRARVKLYLSKESVVKYRGTSYFSHAKTVELSVTVLEEPENKIEISDPSILIPIRFRNTKNFLNRAVLDSSCSGFAISIAQVDMPSAWSTVFCHAVHPLTAPGYSFRLDVKVLWQSEANDPLLTELALDSRNPEEKVVHGKNSFALRTALPERFHPLSVGVGFGPYLHNDVLRPFFTIYAGYTLNETIRLSSFSAVPIGDSPHLDQGFYLITEQTKGLDDHLSVNLLLGAHLLEFNTGGKGYLRFSAPQGIELQYRDFLAKHRNFTVGTFYYPEINGTSYVNCWSRYSWGPGFLEVNYIRWKEAIETGSYSAKSFGLSYGLPLFRAL